MKCKYCPENLQPNCSSAVEHFSSHHLCQDFPTDEAYCIFCNEIIRCQKQNADQCFKKHLLKSKNHELGKLRPPHSDHQHQCPICHFVFPLFASADRYIEDVFYIRTHYLQHFQKQVAPGQSIDCIFPSCGKRWTKREIVTRCFLEHEKHQLPLPVSIIRPPSPPPVVFDGSGSPHSDNEETLDISDVEDSNLSSLDEGPSSFSFDHENPRDCTVIESELSNLFGALKYVFRLQDEGLDLISKTLKNLGKAVKEEVTSLVQTTLLENSVEANSNCFMNMSVKLNETLHDIFYHETNSSRYKRKKYFSATENVIPFETIQLNKEKASDGNPSIETIQLNCENPKDVILVFNAEALVERFLKTQNIVEVWESAKKTRLENDMFNQECEENNEPLKKRYLTTYDGERIKEKLRALPPGVHGVCMIFYLDDFNADKGYSKRGTTNKILGIFFSFNSDAFSVIFKLFSF